MSSIHDVSTLLNQTNSVVLCDQNTSTHCFPLLNASIPKIVIPSGEEHKTLESCNLIWDGLIRLGSGRFTTLICLGGGMISDIGAFAASCFQRGINFVLVPTSLLAMVDASIGGKCGIDYKYLKNYVGLFAEAEEIIICPEFLKTLPINEWRNGKIEMLKHGLIADKLHFNEMTREAVNEIDGINNLFIQRSIDIKLRHTLADYKELGIRKRLNLLFD